MKLQTIEEAAPSHWASYLINGDASGIEESDVRACDAWLDRIGAGAPVSMLDDGSGESDLGFCHGHDVRLLCPEAPALGCNMSTFQFLKRVRA